jgi:transcriptional/translational regulatory protein YebC/TACO1
MELALEAGAEDLELDGDRVEITTAPESLHAVRQALEEAGVVPDEARIAREPQNTVHLEGKKAAQCLKLLEEIEDHDDVQNLYANLEVDEETLRADAG